MDNVGAMSAMPSPTKMAVALIHQRPPPEYEKYLRRKLWKTIRGRILERDGGRCFRCNGGADEVHHRSYAPEVMEGLADGWLVSLCGGCHTVVEFDDSGGWRSWAEKERVLFTPDTGIDIPEPSVNLRLRQWQFDPPVERAQMSSVRRAIWMRRSRGLWVESRKVRRLPVEIIHPNREAAEAAAFAILDEQPSLAGRFRSSGELLHLALLTRGHELPPRSRRMMTGYRPAAAKKRFEKRIVGAMAWTHCEPVSEGDRAILESAATWNRRLLD